MKMVSSVLAAGGLAASLLVAAPAASADTGATPATATSSVTTGTTQVVPEIDPVQYALAFQQFSATDLKRDVIMEGKTKSVTFHLPEGLSLTMVDPASVAPSTTKDGPQYLGAGRTRYGFYVSFNRFDQNVLSNAVGAAALTAAICAIPVVGTAACIVAGVAVSVGISYVHRNGVCSGGRTLYWWDIKNGSTIGCRSSKPS